MQRNRIFACLFGLLLPLASGCDDDRDNLCDSDACIAESDTESNDTEADTEDETEGESEGETEGDSEGETEGDSEGETEGESEGETEGETEGDSESETEGETEGDSEGEDDCANGVCAGESCDTPNATIACGDDGLRYCSRDSESWEYIWGHCVTGPTTCMIGETKLCSPDEPDIDQTCQAIDGEPRWDWEDCNTPLVLAFDNQPVQFTASTADFDISGNGCVSTDWPTAATPWLALDRDRSGTIDGGHELFGNGTRMGDGARAEHGFAALGALDSNADGRITQADARWGELVLWADHDGDKQSTLWELTPLAEHGVTAIELSYWQNPLCDARQNCEVERASFTFAGRTGAEQTGSVVDVYLACQ